jgi:glycosyltransferase involved in cell wall biosynthesis
VKIAYLINRYPKASHSFIRREICGLEELGFEVERISVRKHGDDLVDARDLEEAERTHVLLGSMARLLWDVLVCFLTGPFSFLRGLKQVFEQGIGSDRGVLRHLAYFVEAASLLRLASAKGFRHVHAHFGTNPPVVCGLARTLGGLRFSFTVHGPEEFDRPVSLKLGNKIAQADFVVAISEYGRSQLYRWSDHEYWKKIHVVHCGVDDLFLSKQPPAIPDRSRFVCVGRLCEQKGQLLLVEATARLVNEEGLEVELVLAGDGEMRGAIEEMVVRCGIEDKVRITGWIDNNRVREEILAARALVLPSFAEGLPVVLMESLASRRPVISTYVAGIPELVVPEESGWLVPAGDIDALVRAMRAALTAPLAELEAMGRSGAERVRMRHDARRESSKLAVLLRRCA